MNRKKILFINPNLLLSKKFIDYPYSINLNMLQAVALLKKEGYFVDVIDAFSQKDSDIIEKEDCLFLGSKIKMNEIIKSKNFDIAIILNSPFLKLFSSKENKEIQELMNSIKSKKNKPKIILADCYMGGMHYINYKSEKILEKYPLVDKICKFECDSKLISILQEENIKEKPNEFCNDLNALPFPDYDSISLKNYIAFLKKISEKNFSDFFKMDEEAMPVFTSRGCIYNCIFCISRLNNRGYRQYSLEYLKKHLLLLKHKYNIKKIIIMDELANPTKKRLEDILKLLDGLKLNYEFPNGLRADNISKTALSMIKDKVSLLSVSAESGSQNTIDNIIGKKLDLEKIKQLAEYCTQKKIPLAIHFMIGLPGEDYKDINQTIDFAVKLFNEYGVMPLLQLATPIPGTDFFYKLKLSKSQEQDILDNYVKYFSKGNKFSKIPAKDLDIFMENFNIIMKVKKEKKVIINTTYACNNNCIFCAVGTWRDRKPSIKLQKLELKKAYMEGKRMVDFDGGEPTLSKNLFYLIKYSKNLGFNNINLITNGRMLSIRKNVEMIVKNGITSILFSLHGPNKEIHEQITRTENSFNQTIVGIKNILKINKHIKNPVNVEINITLTNKNILYLNNFFEMVEKMKIKKVNIQFITPFGFAQKKDLPKKEDVLKILPEILDKYSEKINIKIINLPYCYLKGYEKYLIQDVLKKERNMVFIGQEERNLADFLSSKRYKDTECDSCVYNIICGGKWKFDN